VKVSVARGNLFDPVRSERFDLVASNPPYLPSADGAVPEQGAARAWEGGADGRLFIDGICADVQLHLRPGGVLLLVHSSVCGEQQTLSMLAARGLDASVIARHRGPLGPRLAARASQLTNRGIDLGDEEELLVFRAAKPHETP
jgi:release factor glutamine methyltransferase